MTLRNILFVFLFSSQIAAVMIPFRCETTGDSLDAAQAMGRRAWAWKCLPNDRYRIKIHDKMKDTATGMVVDGYPTFALVDDNGDISNPKKWFAPTNEKADCTIPENYYLVIFCSAGCYTPEQKIWFEGGKEAIGDAYIAQRVNIMTLDSTSELKSLKFTPSEIENYITDLIPGTHDVLEFHMLSGGILRVTYEHPLVDSEGRMRSARSLKIGEALVMANGDFDPIISIDSEKYFGKVYNLEVTNQNLVEKIIVAQGYLNGTVYYQNEGLREINRIVLRVNLIPDSLVN